MKTLCQLIAVVLLNSLVHFASAMPPSPDLLNQLSEGSIQQPYYLTHRNELTAYGVDQGNLIPYFEHFRERHHLDDVFNVLVIMVDFSDNTSSVSASGFDQLLYGNATGTVANYYSQVSYGNLTIATVNLPSALGWKRAPQTYSYYVNGQNGFGTYPHNAQKLAEDAIALVNPFVDFSQYDNDGDHYVDALFIIHAGSGAEFTGNNNQIWSHSWVTNSLQSVDGVSAYHYTVEPEFWSSPGDMTCGVYAHEMGHMVFGLPDLYDTGNDSYGLGRWSLMAGGSWNGALGNSPAHPDAWSRIQMGFVSPTVISGSSSGVSIPAVESSPTVYKLTSMSGNAQQYVLVENRQLSGYDASLPGSGLLIYHVDDETSGNTNQWYPGHITSGHYRVALEQADGLWQLEQNSNIGNSGDAYPGSVNNRNYGATSSPNSNDYLGQATGIAVQNISNSSATMTADLVGSAAASLTLSYPNGGETWVEGTQDTIRWSSTGLSDNIRIDINRGYPSGSWAVLAASAPNTGSYPRSVPTGTTTTARIRITAVSHSTLTDVSNANFTVSAGSISVTSPNGGETWIEGTQDTIRWTSSSFSDSVKIEINRAYPTGSWTTLVASAPNTGWYPRNVPTGSTTSARIRISRVTRSDVNDVSDGNFTVSGGTLTLISPNGGETWIEGTQDTIRWTSSNFTENVKIELNRSYPTGSWVTLVTSAPNTGRYPRNVPTGATTSARVRISGVARTDIIDVSDANFSVSGGTVSLTSPNGGETWIEGTQDTIHWSSSNFTDNVKIEINRAYPTGSWATLVASTGNTGWYPRVVPTGATTSARLRISGVTRTDIADVSDANFTVSGGSLTLASPNGGETWIEGTRDTIRWTSSNFSDNVKIEINQAYPSGSWAVLVSSAPNTGSYPRNVPTGASTTVRLRISGVSRSDINDISDANFTVRVAGAPPISNEEQLLTNKMELFQNFPNPFNNSTTIQFSLHLESNVNLTIYNSAGARVVTLAESHLAPGTYQYEWSGSNSSGSAVASGVYFCRLSTNGMTDMKKIILMK